MDDSGTGAAEVPEAAGAAEASTGTTEATTGTTEATTGTTEATTGAAGAATGRDRSRARIVEVAAGLLAAGGRDAVSTRAVALAASTQAPAIYRLFGDKDGLLDAVAEYGFASYLARKPSPAPGADPVADLRAGWDLHVSFGLENPALFALMYGDATGRERESPAAAAAFAMLRQRVRAIAAAGRLRVSEQLAADMLHAAGCGTVLTLLELPEEARTPQLSAAMFEAVTGTVTTPGPAPRPDGGPGADAGTARAPAPVASVPAGSVLAGSVLAGSISTGSVPAGSISTSSVPASLVPAANALRAQLPALTSLSPGERHVLGEWLDRMIAEEGRPALPAPAARITRPPRPVTG